MQKSRIYLLTDTFPYGEGEKTFVIPEIEALREEYDIAIISTAPSEMIKQKKWTSNLDDDIRIFRFCPEEEKKFLFYGLLLFWIKKICWIEVKEIIKTRQKILLRIWKSMLFYAKAESLSRWIKKNNIIDDNEEIYYSYWYNEKVLAALICRERYPKMKIVTRAHGYDLFDERMEDTQRQPFKKIMDSGIDRIMFVSQYNLDYYIDKFGTNNCQKYLVRRIGAPGTARYPKTIKRKKIFRIVSCSSIIKLKRIPLIVDALKLLRDVQIEWIHFGIGCDEQNVKEYAQNNLNSLENISFCFKGYLPRHEIYEYYANHYVHCFINVSETEGSPVSMQEALAFGIPVIGTDVGGVSEMIEGNGFLLNANPSALEVAEKLNAMYALNEEKYNEMRKRSLEIWSSDYNLAQNMQSVLETLKRV